MLVDSLSPAWSGVDGTLDQVDRAFNNKYAVTPKHNDMINAIPRYTLAAHPWYTVGRRLIQQAVTG